MGDRLANMTVRQRRWVVAGLLLLAAIVIGTVLALSATKGFEGKYALPAAGSATPVAPVGPVPPPVGRATPPRATVPPPTATTTDREDEDDGAVDEEDADRIAGAIARTTRKALRRGETVHWHKAGEEGYVSVGAPHDDGERLCREVTAVITRDGGETASRSHLWCALDEDGDDWVPAGEGA